MPSPRKLGKKRGALPGVSNPGLTKQLVLNMLPPVKAEAWELMPLTGAQTTLGRWLPSSKVGSDMVIAMGWPLCRVQKVDTVQPPMAASNQRFIARPSQRLR